MGGKQRRRKKLMERDGPFCVCCKIESEQLQIHHIKKRCNGGTNDLENLALLCACCHVAYHRNEHPNFWRWTEQMREYLYYFLRLTDKSALEED